MKYLLIVIVINFNGGVSQQPITMFTSLQGCKTAGSNYSESMKLIQYTYKCLPIPIGD